jgi:outer membrane protein assembly factor BamB
MRSRGLLFPFAVAWLALAVTPARPAPAQQPAARLLWLVELGAESLVATPGAAARKGIVTSVPGAAYVFDVTADGSLKKRMRLAADPAAPYGVAVAEAGVALADRQGALRLLRYTASGELQPRWRRELAERVTSVAWDGGRVVLAATWKGRLLAFAAADGAPAWSVDLSGRAEAPAVFAGEDVFVVTKARALVRISATTGAIRWRAALSGTALHPPVLPAGTPRLVLCGTWEGEILAYDAASGRLRWSAPLGARLAGAPLAGPGVVAVVTADGAVRGYDLAGRSLWSAPGAAEGPATLLMEEQTGSVPRLLSVSRMLTALEVSSGRRIDGYPQGALEALRRRFADAMLEGVKTYSEAEKSTLHEKEAFEIAGPCFGPARLFGPHLAFGSEEGWAYVFDASRLRPTARYRGGEPARGLQGPVGERALVASGDDLFALDWLTGAVAWKRAVGPRPVTVASEQTLGVVAGGRLHAIGIADGALQWSQRGSFRAVAPPVSLPDQRDAAVVGLWLVDDGEGRLQALLPPGRFVGAPLPVGGDLLAVVPLAPRAWLAATREGRLFGVAFEEPRATDAAGAVGRLVGTAEKAWGEPLTELRVVGGRALLRSASGTLASLDPLSLEESWRLTLSGGDTFEAQPDAGVLLVLGGALGVYDWASGAPKARFDLASPALSARLRGGSLEWLDRSGGVSRAALADGRVETTQIEHPLEEARPAGEGFLVTTAAGEVGFVTLAAGGFAAPSGQAKE